MAQKRCPTRNRYSRGLRFWVPRVQPEGTELPIQFGREAAAVIKGAEDGYLVKRVDVDPSDPRNAPFSEWMD
jgi:hypothetical protein